MSSDARLVERLVHALPPHELYKLFCLATLGGQCGRHSGLAGGPCALLATLAVALSVSRTVCGASCIACDVRDSMLVLRHSGETRRIVLQHGEPVTFGRLDVPDAACVSAARKHGEAYEGRLRRGLGGDAEQHKRSRHVVRPG